MEQGTVNDPGVLGLMYVVKSMFNNVNNLRVLDLGCAEGFNMLPFIYMGAKIYGLDISITKLNYAKKTTTNVVQSIAEKLPFKDKSFDYVLCTEVLEHALYPDQVLREIKRVTRKYSVISFPSLSSPLHKILWPLIKWKHKNKEEIMQKGWSGHLHYFGYMRIKKMCRQAGLTIKEARGYGVIYQKKASKLVQAMNIILAYMPFSRYFGTFLVIKVKPK